MTKKSPMLPIEELVQQYSELSQQEKSLQSRKKKLAEQIKQYAEDNCVKDDKGSYYGETSDFIYGKQARQSVNFHDGAAAAFLLSRGFSKAVKTVLTVDADVLNDLVSRGEVSYEDLKQITEVKVTYAVSVQPKEVISEDVPYEIQPTTIQKRQPIAASAKTKKLPFSTRGK